MRRKLLKILSSCASFLICALITNPAAAETIREPDFSCLKPLTEIDQLVCATPELRKLNDRLAENYQAFMKTLDTPQNQHKLKNLQSRWLDNREKVICMNNKETEKKIACLQHIYEYRCQKLADWATRKNWDFFKDEKAFLLSNRNIQTIVSKNGEEILIAIGETPSYEGNAWTFPEAPEEKIEFYVNLTDAYLGDKLFDVRGGIFEQTEDVIKIWKGGENSNPKTWVNDMFEYGKVKIYPWDSPTVQERKQVLDAVLSTNTNNIFFNYNVDEKNCAKLIHRVQKAKDDLEIIYPILTAKSKDELKEKAGFACDISENNEKLFDAKTYGLIAPYDLYEFGNMWLFGGIRSNNYHGINTVPDFYLFKKNNCEMIDDKKIIIVFENNVLTRNRKEGNYFLMSNMNNTYSVKSFEKDLTLQFSCSFTKKGDKK